ncbi:hypothetical protein GOBAR_DD09112 [Gossypium barbadense]|nr:hypothetical protein GOBAR_DD09112 [Gossypium barbadense]
MAIRKILSPYHDMSALGPYIKGINAMAAGGVPLFASTIVDNDSCAFRSDECGRWSIFLQGSDSGVGIGGGRSSRVCGIRGVGEEFDRLCWGTGSRSLIKPLGCGR